MHKTRNQFRLPDLRLADHCAYCGKNHGSIAQAHRCQIKNEEEHYEEFLNYALYHEDDDLGSISLDYKDVGWFV